MIDMPYTPDNFSFSDSLFPEDFPERASKIHYFPVADSTMDIARDMANKGCPNFTVVIAGTQEKGRGRLKRVWLSSQGGLYFTIVLRPEIPAVLGPRINFFVSLTLAETLRKMFGINALVKWPNDILVEGKKISGMLSEMKTKDDMVLFVNIGIGINVNNDPKPKEQRADSLKGLLGEKVSRNRILAKFLDELERSFNNIDYDKIIVEWKKFSATIGRHVKIVTSRETTEGLAVDVDEDGALVLKLCDGSIKKIVYGDCFEHRA